MGSRTMVRGDELTANHLTGLSSHHFPHTSSPTSHPLWDKSRLKFIFSLHASTQRGSQLSSQPTLGRGGILGSTRIAAHFAPQSPPVDAHSLPYISLQGLKPGSWASC